jgi:hypothetical protein
MPGHQLRPWYGLVAPPEFAAFVMAEQAKWGPVVRAIGAKLE